ncbi:gamma-glutamylcyclotransferase family protein [Roseiflexus castenholzii]|uniref:AIG2 family protein n=1 Tax=Roseiflexus castenholzii (strain DSM 13941 / HLO8) TaxID=383372 RepID=A7NRR6_ROSCS|nr:gamma-glutamylcyclotransferase family protein [Roseiflexus castenholzii]ABU60262.1 AIG2 family protein [Roseiflexus castenholzii DSM 13941]
MDQWYFAYGSNLSKEQMEERIGSSREARVAWLTGYRLVFNKRSKKDGTGKANIVPAAGATVWGVVYRCSYDDLQKMDKCEGVKGGHYQRHAIRVQLDSGEELDAVTYVAGERFLAAESLKPSTEYLETIITGARQHRLPDDYIRSIEALAGS